MKHRNIHLPRPICPLGYPRDQVLEILKDYDRDPADFWKWMRGQTCGVCSGSEWSEIRNGYVANECAGHPHGSPIVYECDIDNFLRGGPITD